MNCKTSIGTKPPNHYGVMISAHIITQICRISVALQTLAGKLRYLTDNLLYHEAKMFACKDIFAKPSMVQPRKARGGRASKSLRSNYFCTHYNINTPANARRQITNITPKQSRKHRQIHAQATQKSFCKKDVDNPVLVWYNYFRMALVCLLV